MEKIVTEGLVLAAASVLGGSFSLFHNLGLSCWFFPWAASSVYFPVFL